jgi:hypothetical protein
MAFGFPARFNESRTYFLPQGELAAVVRSALDELGWSYERLSDEEFRAAVPFGGGTWGEQFKIRILPGGVVKAESKCVTVRAPQLFDFGKNRRNVETFFGLVEHGVREGVDARPVSATDQGAAGRVGQATPARNLAALLFGGCLILILALFALAYLVPAVVGLLTGNLYLVGRGRDVTVHGAWARIISAIILALFAWLLVRVLRYRRKRQA